MRRLRRDALSRPAMRTAGLTTAVVFVLLVVLCAGVDLFVMHDLMASADQRLDERLSSLTTTHDTLFSGAVRDQEDRNLEAPVLAWAIDGSGKVVNATASAPSLPASLRGVGSAQQATVGGVDLRVSGVAVDDGRVVAAVSMAPVSRALTTMLVAEAIFGPLLLAAVFVGALAIAYRVAGPVERARRRHVAFTADASHELRTPLAVIEAETTLALGAQRDAAGYREALERVAGESGRLRRIVDDLLWLARFDAEPEPPRAEPVDLAELAATAAERFRTVASRRGVHIRSERRGDRAAVIDAPVDWVDRLCGVLLDNACKYSPPGGDVEVLVGSDHNGVSLRVRDHGPGIPVAERALIFGRFHRATDSAGGSGLGLAIGDAVVRATGGRWDVGDTPGGGASITVTWQRSSGAGFDRVDAERARVFTMPAERAPDPSTGGS
ncbi:MAG TPA: HAMP domain-containing sensor histidine kinase [Candidatus Angelobacter sp.]|jgi:signal transduction histidine kinase|nr:HAMP domain-containing sensor histidine kinase [Candidatus Angelobacter sp.]